MKSRSRECLTNPCSEFLLSETSYDCVEECQELLNRISLDGHNERRRRHVDTPDLVYDPSLCADAQRHADLLASTETFEHDQSLGQKGLGENLYQVTPIRRSEVRFYLKTFILKLISRMASGIMSQAKPMSIMKTQ